MPIDPDIIDRVKLDFPAAEVPFVLTQLEFVSESQRILRCIVFAARGNSAGFDQLCRLAKVDYRDVIMAAEYDRHDNRLHDFTKPIPEARIASD